MLSWLSALRTASKYHSKITARSYDQIHMGFDGLALLDLIDRCWRDAERLRIQGGKVDHETTHL